MIALAVGLCFGIDWGFLSGEISVYSKQVELVAAGYSEITPALRSPPGREQLIAELIRAYPRASDDEILALARQAESTGRYPKPMRRQINLHSKGFKIYPDAQRVVWWQDNGLVAPLGNCAVRNRTNWACRDEMGNSIGFKNGDYFGPQIEGVSTISKLRWWLMKVGSSDVQRQ